MIPGMKPSRLTVILIACLAVASCGEEKPPATFEVFTIDLVDLEEGDRVTPGVPLRYDVRYQGNLARDLRFKAVFTHEPTGETDSSSWSEPPQDVFRVDFRRVKQLEHPFLKRPGRIRVQLEASITATRTGSTPWVTQSEWVFSELNPTLSLQIDSPATGAPIGYGTPFQLRLTGSDLWGDVTLHVLNEDTGGEVPNLELSVPFGQDTTEVVQSWTLRAPALEKVGTHRLKIVARYGVLEVGTEIFSYVVTHTIDEVEVVLRRPGGEVVPAAGAIHRLDAVTELGLRLRGTLLGGRPFTVNGGSTSTAPADEFDLMVRVPNTDDFASGKGQRTYDFLVSSGGIERTASVTLQRWGIDDCGWFAADGRRLEPSEAVAIGTPISMRAWLWGFPDTETVLFFKSPLAKFTVWERDPGGRPDEPITDSVQNNDDHIESSDAEIHAGFTEAVWDSIYTSEFDLFDLNVNAAEYDFDVQVEDQVCTSGEILVY